MGGPIQILFKAVTGVLLNLRTEKRKSSSEVLILAYGVRKF